MLSGMLSRLMQFFGLFSVLLLGMALGVLTFALVFAGEIYEYQDSFDGAHLLEVDAIVCLAGGRGRIAAAGDLWYRYWEAASRDEAKLPVLYVSGMGPLANWNVFARQLRRGVLESLKPEHVVLETESVNTESNALWLARYARQRGWSRMLLVTSPYHMRRARYIFERVLREAGRSVEISTVSVIQEPFEAGEWRTALHSVRVTVIEYVKWLYYKSFWKPDPAALRL